ncbi:MAG: AAA family ATPase [Chloroflexi bacterium]|nr:AAA family ATPase [Chloroflexota bacterium]
MARELSPDELRRPIDPATLGITSTQDRGPLQGIIGQERAVHALEFGLAIQERGYNIFVAGVPGTGRTTAIRAFLEQLAQGGKAAPDLCYVYNFGDPDRPRALCVPPGQGRSLQQGMKTLTQRVREQLPQVLESDEYMNRRQEIRNGFQRQREEVFAALNQKAQEQGFTIQATPVGFFIIPVIGGRPINDQDFLSLDPDIRERLRGRKEVLENELRTALKQLRDQERTTQEQLENLNREVALHIVSGLIEDVQEHFTEQPEVVRYMKDVQEHMVSNIGEFLPTPPPQEGQPTPSPWTEQLVLRKYEVNVLMDRTGAEGAPVVIEDNPTYANLFGRIEKETYMGFLHTDFTLIKGGSLHKANGGYLVLPVLEVLRNPFVYESLKRALRSREIDIEEPGERLGFVAMKSLHPEPAPLDVKVALVGTPPLYQLLFGLDEDFRELFKVKAEFDSRMESSQENIRDYIAFISTLCSKENLKPMYASGVARIIEYGFRLAEDRQKLSTRFAELADLIREANFWAGKDGGEYITGRHVQRALDEKVYRSNLIQERIRELVARGVILVDTQGAAVGQVNGLAVLSLGDYSFGRPTRITASVGLGRAGILDIEREARLGGPIHTKGVMILGGYLTHKYAQDKPLSLSARLAFEQSYEGVEGDSASAAELYALLSALSGLPLKQNLAVTGSVNQMGMIQAIGGANEKIEGYFEVCQVQGLTGEQGVVIPESNVQHLMLRLPIIEAVQAGKFHIYSARTIDEGMELLTGTPAGARQPDGTFPPGTISYRVDQRLREMARRLRAFAPEEPRSGAQEAP